MREMSQERWAQIEDIFHAALELPVHERSDFLNTSCAGDPELRREVEALLE
jgi:non-specific serine/threonine protein kinase/serine/threonine-protein kinase